MEANTKITTEEIIKKAEEVIKKNTPKLDEPKQHKKERKKQKYTNKVFVYHKFDCIEKERLYPIPRKDLSFSLL